MSIEFSDEKKIIEHFIDGEWAEVFWSSCDLEEFAEMLLEQFINHPHGDLYKKHEVVGRGKYIEGYDHFVSNFACDEYVSTNELTGTITIKIVENNYRTW